jgi:hypothetical protein
MIYKLAVRYTTTSPGADPDHSILAEDIPREGDILVIDGVRCKVRCVERLPYYSMESTLLILGGAVNLTVQKERGQ